MFFTTLSKNYGSLDQHVAYEKKESRWARLRWRTSHLGTIILDPNKPLQKAGKTNAKILQCKECPSSHIQPNAEKNKGHPQRMVWFKWNPNGGG